ncbi:MAG: hypothetical protein Q9160_006756 [Pyrenula sp. 1 TL-2023]
MAAQAEQGNAQIDVEAQVVNVEGAEKLDFPSPSSQTTTFGGSKASLLKRQSSQISNIQQCQRGYPRLAAFLDSDENFMIYRRFGYLQARVLLDKQNELQRLEKELEVDDESANEDDLGTGEVDSDIPSERKKLLMKIEAKYREYGKDAHQISSNRILKDL